MENVRFRKVNEINVEGSIIFLEEGGFKVSCLEGTKDYRTYAGARAFMTKNGYTAIIEEEKRFLPPIKKTSKKFKKRVANVSNKGYNKNCKEQENKLEGKKETGMKIIEYVSDTGNNRGGIMCYDNGSFHAFTKTVWRDYKTLRGARKFMERFKYVEVVEEAEEVVEEENILDVTGANYNDMVELKERFIGNWNRLPLEVQYFILNECNSYDFVFKSLILRKDQKIISEGSFYIKNGKIFLESLGAGDLFQWTIEKGLYEISDELKIVEKVGFMIQEKKSEKVLEEIEGIIKEVTADGSSVPAALTKVLENAKNNIGKWCFVGAKDRYSEATEIYKSHIQMIEAGTEIRLIKCPIKYFKKSGRVIRDNNITIFKVIEKSSI